MVLLFLVPFWVAGIFLLKIGFTKAKANAETSVNGQDSFGLVIDFSDSGCYVNNNPVWNVHVLVATEFGQVQTFVEQAGTNPKYGVGHYVSVKYYNGDVNILNRISEYAVPDDIKTRLKAAAPTNIFTQQNIEQQRQPQDFIVRGDTIIIDGVEYKRPN